MIRAGENLCDLLPSVWQTVCLLVMAFFVSVCVIASHAPEKVAEKRQGSTFNVEVRQDAGR